MKSLWGFVTLSLCFSLITGCNSRIEIDKEKEKAAIIKLQSDAKKVLIAGDFDSLLEFSLQEFYEVSNGEMKKNTHAKMRENFEKGPKFKEVEIIELEEPIIRISNDGTMAWAIGKRRFSYTYENSTDPESRQISEYSYLQIFEKEYGKWKYSDQALCSKK